MLTLGLDGLAAEGLLERLVAPGETSTAAYALRRPGAALLAARGEDLPPRLVPRRHSLHTLRHELALNDLAVVLERLHQRRALDLLDWQTARERLAAVAHVLDHGRVVRVPLVADALAVLRAGAIRLGFLVEVDMGTVSTARMAAKFAGYHAWWSDGGPVRRFGLAATRVLTLVSTRRRLEQLRALAMKVTAPRGSGLFWFAPLTAVDVDAPERFLDPIASVARPGDDRARTLLASPTP